MIIQLVHSPAWRAGGESDFAGSLRLVSSRTRIDMTSQARTAPRLHGMTGDLRLTRAVVQNALPGVSVAWPPGLNALDLSRKPLSLHLTLTSEMPYVPLKLSSISVTTSDIPVSASVSPASLELWPRRSQSLTLTLIARGSSQSTPVPASGMFSLSAVIQPATFHLPPLPDDVLFSTGSWTLGSGSAGPLGTLLQQRLDPFSGEIAAITLTGYTDSVPDTAIGNLELSKRRAQAVASWLEMHGIPARLIHTVGAGATHFVASNNTPQGRARNRRVVVAVALDHSLLVSVTDRTAPVTLTGLPSRQPPGGIFPSIHFSGLVTLTSVRMPGQTAHGSFVISPGAGAKGCTWLVRELHSGQPATAGTVTYKLRPSGTIAHCLPYRSGTPLRIDVTATVTGYGVGTVRGAVVLALRNSQNTQLRETIPVQFRVAIPLVLSSTTAVGLLFVGILGPLALMYLWLIITARFEPFDQLRYLAYRMRLVATDQGWDLAESPQPQVSEIAFLSGPKNFRSFECEGLTFRARLPWTPFGVVTGRVSADGQRVVSSDGSHMEGRWASVPLGLGAVWIAVIDEPTLAEQVSGDPALRRPIEVRLVFLLRSDDPPEERILALWEGARQGVPKAFSSLSMRLRSKPRAQITSPPDAPRPDTEQQAENYLDDLPSFSADPQGSSGETIPLAFGRRAPDTLDSDPALPGLDALPSPAAETAAESAPEDPLGPLPSLDGA